MGHTTMANKSVWACDRVVSHREAMGQDGDKVLDDGEAEGEEGHKGNEGNERQVENDSTQ